MKISLEQVCKRFQRHWIFSNITCSFTAPGAWALLGANGSGKSTLLRIIGGMQAATQGSKITYTLNGKSISANSIFPYISFCAPGMELVEELTLREFFDFHFSFKHTRHGLSVPEIIDITGLAHAADKQIGDFSSGMKQRVKLAQAIFADTPVLLLDEPCTNLDQAGVDQYTQWMENYTADRLVIVASNDVREYFFCKERLSVEDYK